MERLTEKHYSGNGYYLKCSSECPNDGFCDDCEKLFKVIDRLGEYEDKAEQKPKTNADRFRAMSDEELEKAIGHRSLCYYIQDTTNFCEERASCGDCIREWLKQPAGGDGGG